MDPPRRMLITAGPTQEPIDAVRFIGNRSSGRLGVALADEAAKRGWPVTLLLGPTSIVPARPEVTLRRFRTAANLESLLHDEFPRCDVLIMAAAVADYRPSAKENTGKLQRSNGRLVLELESTPDLLASCAAERRPEQLLIGFALEPRDRLIDSARQKIRRKRIDAIVANPLETMDSAEIEAILIDWSGATQATHGAISKESFAPWLLDRIRSLQPSKHA